MDHNKPARLRWPKFGAQNSTHAERERNHPILYMKKKENNPIIARCFMEIRCSSPLVGPIR